MPRRGARRGARPLRWAVDLSPAEFAYVEAARGAVATSRAAFVLAWACDLERRLIDPQPTLAQARAVLDAEHEVLDEEDNALDRDRTARGGRRPTPRVLAPTDVATAHATARLRPQSAARLHQLLTDAPGTDA